MKALAIFLIFTICFTATTALSCYNCFFMDGHLLSDPQCQSSPTTVATCSVPTSTPTSLNVKGYLNSNEKIIYTTEEIESKQGDADEIFLCAKFTGNLDAKSVVLRSCGYLERQYEGICTTNATLDVFGRYASDVLACFCTGDQCNGATSLQFTYFTFLVIIVHLIYNLSEL